MLQLALRGTVQKLVAVFIAGVPAIIGGSLVYQMLTGESWLAGITAMYGGLYHIPGAAAPRPRNWVKGFREIVASICGLIRSGA